jgi:hypothetical protein
MVFVTDHAIRRFIERIAPYITYDQAKEIILDDLKTIQREDVKQAKSNYYVRVRSKWFGKHGTPYKYRLFIAPQEKTPEKGFLIVTIHRG